MSLSALLPLLLLAPRDLLFLALQISLQHGLRADFVYNNLSDMRQVCLEDVVDMPCAKSSHASCYMYSLTYM